jgi:copper transport protein
MKFRLLFLLVILFVALGPSLARSAEAHANYVSSSPAANAILLSPPASVAITLSEAARPGSPTIRVTNVTGVREDNGAATVNASRPQEIGVALLPIGPGIYTVTWTVVSAVDGHFTAGSFAFAIQNPDGSLPGPLPTTGPTTETPISPMEVALQFLGFAGLALAAGGTVLARFVWLRSGRDPAVREAGSYRISFQILLQWARAGAFAFGAAMIGLWAQSAGLEGDTGGQSFIGSPYLLSIALRLGLAVALFVVLSAAFRRSRGENPADGRGPIQAALIVAAASVVAGGIGTHAAADLSSGALGAVADMAHLGGAAVWIGGLVEIVLVRSVLQEGDGLPLARTVFAGFSRVAGYCVVLVLAGGVILTLLLVGSIDRLVETGYGWIVLAKISLVVPMLLLGYYNRRRLLPDTTETETAVESVRRLARNVRAETLLGGVVLVLAALLTSMTPAASLAQGPPQFMSLQAVAGGVRIDFEVLPYPTIAGVYTFTFLLWNATTGQAYDGGRNATLTFTLLNSTLPPQTVPVDGPHGNHFFVTTPALSQAGTWTIAFRFSRFGDFDVTTTFHVALVTG